MTILDNDILYYKIPRSFGATSLAERHIMIWEQIPTNRKWPNVIFIVDKFVSWSTIQKLNVVGYLIHDPRFTTFTSVINIPLLNFNGIRHLRSKSRKHL